MRATAEPVDDNRVRLSVEIDEAEIDEALDVTARRLASQIRVPGFRPGRVPRQVLEARLGGIGALRQQAISDALPDLYAQAVVDTEVDPIAPPTIDVTEGEDSGPVKFDAVVEVRPRVTIPGYQGLIVTLPPLEVDDAAIDRQIDRVREQSGELVVVERAVRDGDYVTIDLHGVRVGGDDLDVDDFLYEVGAGSDIPGLDEALRGTKPGEILTFDATMPSGPDQTDEVSFRVLVKEVKEKVLPAVTDEWAAEASEFETVDELRADLRLRLEQMQLIQAQLALRERALDALAGLVSVEPPEALVDAEIRERLHDLGHRLESRRITLDQFLAASGRDQSTLLAELRLEATRAVQIDLALRALADAEELELTDGEIDDAVAEMAEQAGATPDELRDALDRGGRMPAVRSDRRKAKALTWLLDHVELVDPDGAPVDRSRLTVDVSADATEPPTAPVAEEEAVQEGSVEVES